MDRILLQRIREKDKDAFKELYDKYGAYALRVAAAVTGSAATAADAVQEAFIRVYYNLDKFDPDKPFEPWFYRILINECNRLTKKGSKVTYISDYIETNLDVSEEDDYNFVEYEELYRAIRSLNGKIRIPIILKYLRGFKETEIAQILGINLNTLKSRLYKGRQKLKRVLKDYGERSREYQL